MTDLELQQQRREKWRLDGKPIRTIEDARELTLAGIAAGPDGQKMLLASGRLADFASAYGLVAFTGDDSATLDAASAALLGLEIGDRFLAVER